MNLGSFIAMLAVVHTSGHCGEISCMKGQQGAKGVLVLSGGPAGPIGAESGERANGPLHTGKQRYAGLY